MSHDPRGDDELLIFGKRQAPLSETDAFIEEMFRDLFRWSHPVLGPVLRETEGLYRYVFELLAMEVPQRRKAVRSLPYRNLEVAELLLEESAKAAPKRPKQSEERAVLAEWITAQSWPEAREKATRVRAEACMCQGDARRLLCDWQGAELGFGAAFSALQKLPTGLEHVFFHVKLAKLREDQGRLREAADLLWQAMNRYCQYSQSAPPNDIVVKLAYVYLKLNDPGRAMTLFTHLCLQVEGPFAGWHQAEIALGQAMCLAAFGLDEPARLLLDESKPLRRCIFDRDKVLRLEWLECKIAVHLGDLDQAIPRLEAIRRWLLRDQDLVDVCLSSIDLAFAHATRVQAAERLPALLEDLAKLPGASEYPWALGSLWWFREMVEQGRDPADAARQAAEIVHRRETSLLRLADSYPGKDRC